MPRLESKLSRTANPGPNPANIIMVVVAVVVFAGCGYYIMMKNSAKAKPEEAKLDAATTETVKNLPPPTAPKHLPAKKKHSRH